MYTEEELKSWITIRINERSIKSLTISIRNSKDIQQSLLYYTKEHIDLSFSARANIIYNGYRPKCVVCGEYTYFNRNNWEFGETCSKKCAANNVRRNELIKETNISKYGVDCIFKSDNFKEQLKIHNKEKYNTDYYFQSDDCNIKTRDNIREKFGVDNYVQSDDFKNKSKETLLKKYNVTHYSKTDEFSEKFKNTSIKKYGVNHPMQNLSVFEKQQHNSYYFKDYTMPSGKIVRIQGYENLALNELLTQYNEDDIMVSNREIFNRFGKFEYLYDNKIKRYYPDIYIISENKFIEVKSKRTFEVSKRQNLAKRDCVLNSGFKFSFWIYGKEKTIL